MHLHDLPRGGSPFARLAPVVLAALLAVLPPVLLAADPAPGEASPGGEAGTSAGRPPDRAVRPPAPLDCGEARADGAAPAAPEPGAPAGPLRRADELYFSGRPEASLASLRAALRSRPSDFEALWRAARAAASAGLLEEGVEAQNGWYRRGAEYGRRAVRARPERVEGHYWRAANAGLHAVQAGAPRRIVGLGEVVYAEATRTLELDPCHAGGHNVLGRLHFEIMRLSFLERLLGRLLLGGDALAEASWEGAERHLSRAVELDPDFILYRLDLGRLHLRRERPERAIRELGAALRLEPVHPPDRKFQERARRLLEGIRASRGGTDGEEEARDAATPRGTGKAARARGAERAVPLAGARAGGPTAAERR